MQASAETPKQNTDFTTSKPISAPTITFSPSIQSTPDIGLVRRPKASASPSGPLEPESDDPSLPIPPGTHCRRRGCKVISGLGLDPMSRFDERCIYHSGQPIFHEGSKGWTCCKRRVLEFEEFMHIEGCQQRDKHFYVGTRKNEKKEKIVTNIRYVCCHESSSTKISSLANRFINRNRHDFYQTSTNVTANIYLKGVEKSKSTISFLPTFVKLDLVTADFKRYEEDLQLHDTIKTSESTYKIMSTKVELVLIKTNCKSWSDLTNNDNQPN